MLSRISSSAENWTHSSGVAGGMPVSSTIRAGTTSVGTASAKFARMPIQTTRLNQVPAIREPLNCRLQNADCRMECRIEPNQSAICDLQSEISPSSEAFQILHDRAFVGVGERGPVDVAAVAVARH